jgi:hypothetical protein
MSRKVTRTVVVALILTTPLSVTYAGASTLSPLAILTKALHDGSRETSMNVTAAFTGSGIAVSLDGGFTPAAEGGITAESGVGSEDLIEPSGKSYCFVKASSLGVLRNEMDVKVPTAAEVGVWYKVASTDPRYVSIASPGGAQTVAEAFSFSPVGWERAATYEGTTVLRGVRVIKLESASNLFVSGSGFGKTTLYVTDSSAPLPFAMSGPAGTTGLMYFSKWDATSVVIPVASSNLPR